MPFKFNPTTGKLDLVGSGGSGPANSIASKYIVENRTLTTLEATNMQLTLDNTPPQNLKVSLDIVSGVTQEYGTDYIVNGNILSWSGLALETVLSAGDKLRIIYPL